MTLSMSLNWKAPDSSQLVNLRLKDVANKGFVSGGRVTPVPGSLQVNVEPFVCITYDGAVVRSNENVVLNVGDGIVTVIALRARYVPLGSPVMVIQALPVASYLSDPESDWLTVLALVDLTAGAPHSDVPADDILTTWTSGSDTIERHAVDPQDRSSFRAPVVNSGDLTTAGSPYLPPLADNRNGDVVFATDTGTFFWWNGASWSWEIFDEVPLAMHREHEHTNGITGDSAPSTLAPSASGTTVTIAVVPTGSGYTVNGRYRTSPTPVVPAFTRDLTIGGLFPDQGLIQASADEDGVVDVVSGGNGDYRIRRQAGAPPVNPAVRIVDIYDGHSLGPASIVCNAGASTFAWKDGEPVVVDTAVGGRYRLYGPEYVNWIDIEVVSGTALNNGTDAYDVFASKKDDEHMLIAYFWWTPATPVVVLGADKRYFGNLGTQELSDDFKATLPPAWNDLRGNMVYSGGAMSVIGGLTMRITGPLIAYVGGKRFVVPVTTGVSSNGYTGITFPGAGAPQTRFVYVNAAGVLTLSATDPSTVPGLEFAEVGRVVGAAGTIIINEDRRDPQIIVGQATRNSKLVFSETSTTRWHESSSTLNVEKNGDATGTQVYAGTFFAKDNQFIATGHVQLVNDAVSDTPVTDAAHDEIRKYQPPTGRDASLVGAIADGQEAQRFGLGCVGINACPVSCASDGSSVTIGTGTFYDFQGRKVVISAPVVIDTSALANGTYTVDWDGELNSGSGEFEVSAHGSISWRRSLAFAVFNKSGTSVVTNCQLYATGSMCQEEFSLGFDAGVTSQFGRGGNFSTLRKALVFRVCYSGGAGTDLFNAPRRFAVYDQIDEGADLIDFNSFEFSGIADDHLDGMHVYGPSVTATTVNRGILRWGVDGAASAVPMIDFRNQISSVKFTDLRFEYNGDTGVDNNNCWIKNPGQNLVVENCGFAPQSSVGEPLRCLVRYDVTTSLGGTTTSLIPGTLFKNCNFFNICAGTEVLSLETAALAGRVAIENCVFGGTSTYARVVNISSATATCDVTFDNCRVGAFNSAIIEAPVGVTGKLQVVNSTISASPGAALGPSSGTLDVINCVISESVSAYGTRLVSGCKLVGASSLTGNSSTTFQDCDFFYQTTGRFTGSFKDLLGCSIRLGLDGQLEDSGSNDWIQTIDNCYISKSNDNANSNTWFDSAFRGTLFLSNTYVHYSGASTNANSLFQATAPGSQFYISNTHIRAGNRGVGNGAFEFSIRTAGIFPGVVKISDCTVNGLFGSAIFVTHDAGVDDNSSSVIITGCHVSSSVSGVPAIYILGNLTGTGLQIGKVLVNGNTFDLSPAGNAILMEGFVHGEFNDNIVNSISTSQGLVQLGGSDVSALGLQESVTCCRNVFRANAHGYLIHVQDINKYANVSDNTMVVSSAGNVTCQIALDYINLTTLSDERVFMANHNQLTAITSSNTASVVAGILLDTGLSAGGIFGKAFAIGNHIYASKSSTIAGTAEAEIAFDSGPPSESVISNNVIEVFAAGGVGTCTCRTSGESAVMTDNIFHMNAGNTMNTANNATNRKGGTAANVGVVEENIEDLT